jgi:hypothetical protein
MDWTGFIKAVSELTDLVSNKGLPIVFSVVGLLAVIAIGWWIKTIADRKLAKDEERREKDEARKDVLAEAVSKQAQTGEKFSDGIEVIANQAVKQTDLMVRMDARVEDHGRQLREHGAILSEFRTRFKGEGKSGD